jgi:hypothetical protein
MLLTNWLSGLRWRGVRRSDDFGRAAEGRPGWRIPHFGPNRLSPARAACRRSAIQQRQLGRIRRRLA